MPEVAPGPRSGLACRLASFGRSPLTWVAPLTLDKGAGMAAQQSRRDERSDTCKSPVGVADGP